jgi:hypothetical protein
MWTKMSTNFVRSGNWQISKIFFDKFQNSKNWQVTRIVIFRGLFVFAKNGKLLSKGLGQCRGPKFREIHKVCMYVCMYMCICKPAVGRILDCVAHTQKAGQSKMFQRQIYYFWTPRWSWTNFGVFSNFLIRLDKMFVKKSEVIKCFLTKAISSLMNSWLWSSF